MFLLMLWRRSASWRRDYLSNLMSDRKLSDAKSLARLKRKEQEGSRQVYFLNLANCPGLPIRHLQQIPEWEGKMVDWLSL